MTKSGLEKVLNLLQSDDYLRSKWLQQQKSVAAGCMQSNLYFNTAVRSNKRNSADLKKGFVKND